MQQVSKVFRFWIEQIDKYFWNWNEILMFIKGQTTVLTFISPEFITCPYLKFFFAVIIVYNKHIYIQWDCNSIEGTFVPDTLKQKDSRNGIL